MSLESPRVPPCAASDGGDSPALQALTRVPWLRDCDDATLATLLRHARLRTYPPGASVVRRGEPADGLLIVASGSLETSSSTAAGRRFVISYIGPGHVVGLVPILDERGSIHDNVAQERTQVLCVRADDFHAAMDADPALRRRVMRLLAKRSRRLHALLADFTVMPLPVRLARVLLSLRAAYDEGGVHPETITLRVSQEGLAAMLGVPRQRVNAELKALERDGLLRMGYLRIALLDVPGLRARAEDPAG